MLVMTRGYFTYLKTFYLAPNVQDSGASLSVLSNDSNDMTSARGSSSAHPSRIRMKQTWFAGKWTIDQ